LITPVTLYFIPFNSALTVSANALWDTGASMSAITLEIQSKLKASPVSKRFISGIHEAKIVDVVLVKVELPNSVIKKSIEVVVCNIPSNFDVILGMDIISLGDFAISNGNGHTLLSFATPPFQEKIDFSKRQNEP
jgi:hypothetical protein